MSNNISCADDLQQKMDDPANWISWGGDYQGTRYSKLDQINTSNVHELQLKWIEPLQVEGNYEGGPLVINNMIYLYTPYPNKVYALDLETRQIVWEYQYTLDSATENTVKEKKPWKGSANRITDNGLAYGNGKIFLYRADAMLVALDAQTGEEIWQISNSISFKQRLATTTPVVVNDKVIIGISGSGEVQQRGYLTAYDADNGSQLWRAYSIGPDKDLLVDPKKTTSWQNGQVKPIGKNSSLKSWPGKQWQQGGGFPSGWITVDRKRNLLYYGSSEPEGDSEKGPGDTRWTSALWARDIDTGTAKWVYQLIPHDEWGYGAVNESILIDRQVGNTTLPELWHFDANGFVYRLNRESGALLSANKVFDSVNWAKSIDLNSGRPKLDPKIPFEDRKYDSCPVLFPMRMLQAAAAYSPVQQLFFTTSMEDCTEKHEDALKRIDYFNPLVAWDVEKQQIRWQHKEAVSSGVLATAGDLVFYGTWDGYFIASSSKTGEVLYRLKTPSGIISNPVSWHYKNKQYIGVVSGVLWPTKNQTPYCKGPTNSFGPPTKIRIGLDYEKIICHQTEEGMLMVFALPGN